MKDRHGEYLETTLLRVWQVAHVVATITIPWLLAAYYLGSQPATITGEADLVADFHTMAATAAGVLLLSTVRLRLSGRSVAATVPFAVMWVVVLAYSVFQIFEYGDHFQCKTELCMPGFELFFTAIPFAAAVTVAVLCSAAVNEAIRRADACSSEG